VHIDTADTSVQISGKAIRSQQRSCCRRGCGECGGYRCTQYGGIHGCTGALYPVTAGGGVTFLCDAALGLAVEPLFGNAGGL